MPTPPCLPPRVVTRPKVAPRAHRLSLRAPDYPDARPFHEALVRANPERLVWGGDWPHPRVEGEMPDAGHLFELFQQWTPDKATQNVSSSPIRPNFTDFSN
jgi:predicted TIM-barrel fold metal-dependent hydrolase